MYDSLDIALHQYERDQEEAEAIDKATDQYVRDNFISGDSGFDCAFFDELIPGAPAKVTRALEAASRGYNGAGHRAACAAAGAVLLDWMLARAYEIADKELAAKKNGDFAMP